MESNKAESMLYKVLLAAEDSNTIDEIMDAFNDREIKWSDVIQWFRRYKTEYNQRILTLKESAKKKLTVEERKALNL